MPLTVRFKQVPYTYKNIIALVLRLECSTRIVGVCVTTFIRKVCKPERERDLISTPVLLNSWPILRVSLYKLLIYTLVFCQYWREGSNQWLHLRSGRHNSHLCLELLHTVFLRDQQSLQRTLAWTGVPNTTTLAVSSRWKVGGSEWLSRVVHWHCIVCTWIHTHKLKLNNNHQHVRTRRTVCIFSC